jgi:hypothetical protein
MLSVSKKVANMHISILRDMLKQIGYELISKNYKKNDQRCLQYIHIIFYPCDAMNFTTLT